MKKTDVADFLQATSGVEGWFFPVDAYAFGMFDEIQKQEGIGGNLFEVGVHHGKTAIFLARAAAPPEVVGVCDVFESQELNVDHSGEGSRELFLANMRSHTTLPPERLATFAKRSAALTMDETTSHVRFFHIDGPRRGRGRSFSSRGRSPSTPRTGWAAACSRRSAPSGSISTRWRPPARISGPRDSRTGSGALCGASSQRIDDWGRTP